MKSWKETGVTFGDGERDSIVGAYNILTGLLFNCFFENENDLTCEFDCHPHSTDKVLYTKSEIELACNLLRNMWSADRIMLIENASKEEFELENEN